MCYEVTLSSDNSAQPKTWILPLTLLLGKVFAFSVNFDFSYISLPLSDFFCNNFHSFSYNIS